MSLLPLRVTVVGGDGFCGWPLALHLSKLGCEICVIDNFSRRRIDKEEGISPLIPLPTMDERLAAWRRVSGNTIDFREIDVAANHEAFRDHLLAFRPEAIVHMGEQRAAPYSMKDSQARRYTVSNNVGSTHNILDAIVDVDRTIHLVHLGTMGVYGYGDADDMVIPEGYVDASFEADSGKPVTRSILHPTNPGSLYHTTKCLDQTMFAYYCKAFDLRITDLHQGIIYGYETEETRLDKLLCTRFDYDSLYGTVLNRFVVQAASGSPLTVYGTGGQTRAFISLQDSVRCVSIALSTPPPAGSKRARIINQMSEVHRVRDLASKVSDAIEGEVTVSNLVNPRTELAENDLQVCNTTLLQNGYEPQLLTPDVIQSLYALVLRNASNVKPDTMLPTVRW